LLAVVGANLENLHYEGNIVTGFEAFGDGVAQDGWRKRADAIRPWNPANDFPIPDRLSGSFRTLFVIANVRHRTTRFRNFIFLPIAINA
jgi:hypothetical protein